MEMAKNPGCPTCHRADRVTPLPDGAAPPAEQRRPGAGFVWEAPNFRCDFCDTWFRFDVGSGRYAAFRIRTYAGRVDEHLFAPPLGPADASWAWGAAARRVAEAGALDPGTNAFELFGGLKRAGTWLMKGWLAAHGHAPQREWRFDEALAVLECFAGWDASSAMSDFGTRVTHLLYGKPRNGKGGELSPPELRREAEVHLAQAEELLGWLRDGGALPRWVEHVVRGYRQGVSPLPPSPPAPAVPAPPAARAPAIDSAAAVLRGAVVRLDFAVKAWVLAVLSVEPWDEVEPLVALRVPFNGAWWNEPSPDDESGGGGAPDGGFIDLVLPWGRSAAPPATGEWIRVEPRGPGIEAVEPEDAPSAARWLRQLAPADARELAFRAVPLAPVRPRLERVRVRESGPEGEREVDGVWFAFPDDPLLQAAVEGSEYPCALPQPAEATGGRRYLYVCNCGVPACRAVEANAFRGPGDSLVLSGLRFAAGEGERRLGPPLALDASAVRRG